MAYRITKQPDGRFAIWSTFIDDFIFVDGSEEDIVDYYRAEAIRQADDRVIPELEKLALEPANATAKKWRECQEWIEHRQDDPEDE